MDTVDIVQETMLAALRNLQTFESRGEGALQAYLRQALVNRIRSQMRNAMGRPERGLLESGIVDDATSPFDAVIGHEKVERYERALQQLSAEARSAVVARVEMGLGYAEIAELLDKSSADAARMMVARAVIRLAELMRAGTGPSGAT
jgi:RNA polymerase sigma-70 factor (ECF subfamily)